MDRQNTLNTEERASKTKSTENRQMDREQHRSKIYMDNVFQN